MRWFCFIAMLIGLLALGASASPPGPLTVVICAPGYPGNTEQAQPVMDDFARAIEDGDGSVQAVYHETLDGGLERLRREDTAAAIVGIPFYLEYRDELELVPILSVTPESGATEFWSLVARKGALSGPESLEGWKIASMAGFAPAFVERIALAGWGVLPDGVEIEFASRVLSQLRRASRGDPVAVLLDRAQAEAVPALPFADQLEVVARSRPHVASLLCSVGGRLDEGRRARLVSALEGLGADAGTREVLDAMRIEGFGPVASEEVRALERAYDAIAP